MSPDESISPTNSGKEYSLTEIHARLVRSPPPICWPVSPRSNGTFSPDSRYAYYCILYFFKFYYYYTISYLYYFSISSGTKISFLIEIFFIYKVVLWIYFISFVSFIKKDHKTFYFQ